MDRPQDSQLPTKTKNASGAGKKYYLAAYNFASALLWAGVLSHTVQLLLTESYASVYPKAFEYVKWVQSLAVLEIFHAALGVVRTPIMTTIMQVSSRLLLVWGIGQFFPASTAASPAFSSMLIAWSVTEVVRYTYFGVIILAGGVPGFLTWLRYNLFFVLYPLGISSECWLVYKAIAPAKSLYPGLDYALIAVLAIYVPGSYILFTHMMAQRRKTIKSLKGQQKKE